MENYTHDQADELRRFPEERLASGSDAPRLVGDADTLRYIHDLQTQNEALRQREATLQRELAHYAELYEQVPAAYLRLRRDGAILQSNLAGAHILSCGMGELVGQNFMGFVAEPSRAAMTACLDDAFSGARTSIAEISLQPGHRRDDWRFVQVECATTPGVDECRMTLTDISERTMQYRVAVNTMAEGLVVHQKDGAIIMANPSAERILGLSAEQIMGRTSVDPRWQIIHEDGSPFPGETHPAMRTLSDGKALLNIIMGVFKPAGDISWISINSQPLRRPDTDAIYGAVTTFHDISERKNVEKLLRESNRKLVDLVEFKSQFVSMASHEFRSPLSDIMFTAEAVRAYRKRMDDAQVDKYLGQIITDSERMQALVDEILQLTRTQSTGYILKPVMIDLDAECSEIVERFSANPGLAHQIVYTCASQPLYALLDVRLVKGVITNLIANAVKYSPADTTVTVDLAVRDNSLVLRVTDQGIGIPEQDQAHLFEPFYRGSNALQVAGTGLGLSIAKNAVELHDGTIAVESEIGKGTTMTVTLPRR